jgi:hypothetical protein
MAELASCLVIIFGLVLSTFPLRGHWMLNIVLGTVLGFAAVWFAVRNAARRKQRKPTDLASASPALWRICAIGLGAPILYPLWLILRDAAFLATRPTLASQSLCLIGMVIGLTVAIMIWPCSDTQA